MEAEQFFSDFCNLQLMEMAQNSTVCSVIYTQIYIIQTFRRIFFENLEFIEKCNLFPTAMCTTTIYFELATTNLSDLHQARSQVLRFEGRAKYTFMGARFVL